MTEEDAVLRGIGQDMAVGEPHRGIGVRIGRLAFLPLHKAGAEGLRPSLKGGLVAIGGLVERYQYINDPFCQHSCRVIGKVLAGRGTEFLRGGEYAVFEQVVGICLEIDLREILKADAERIEIILLCSPVAVEFQKGGNLLAVELLHIVLVVGIKRREGELQGIGPLRGAPESPFIDGRKGDKFYTIGALHKESKRSRGAGKGLDPFLYGFESAAIGFLALRILADPLHELLLFLLLALDDAEL